MELHAGDIAVVTGGASGIGYALAERFAKAGLHVVAADVEQAALDDAVTRLGEHGTEILGVATDVSNEEAVEALAAATIERFDSVHVVCNNAGVAPMADPWAGPRSTWDWVIGVNLWGVIYGVRAFLPHLVAAGRGHIVNTASMAGLIPGLSAPYDATKHAVVALTEDLFLDLQASGLPVGVSVLCPGWVRTKILDATRNWPGERGALPETPTTLGVVKGHVQRAIDEGMTPAAVADLVANSITEGRFWVLPHPDWMQVAMDRWGTVAEGADPVRLPIPGIPPTGQLFEEIVAAMAEAED